MWPSDQVLAYFDAPCNVGELAPAPDVLRVRVQQDHDGDIVQLSMRVDTAGIIKQVLFKARGACATIAAAAWLTEQLKGQALTRLSQIDGKLICQQLNLNEQERYAAFLIEDAAKQLLEASTSHER